MPTPTDARPAAEPADFVDAASLVRAARDQIRNLTVDELDGALSQPDVLLVDVREPAEVAEGIIPGAISVPRGMLEFHADPTSPYHLEELRPERPVILYCKSGGRSALAAATLQAMGYRDVASLDGGITAWEQAHATTDTRG